MELTDVREDLYVAGAAALGAVALTVGLDFLAGIAVPVRARAVPIAVYFLYLFSRKGGPYGRYDTARTWLALVAVATVAAGAYAIAV